MEKNNKKIILLGIILSLFFFSVFVFTKDIGEETSSVSPTVKKTNLAFLEVNGVKLERTIKEKESVYDFMLELEKEGKIKFKDKTYSGLGKMIEEINGIKSNGDNFWIYYVNGEKAKIGVSNYKLSPGDVVSWKYEKDIN